MPDRIATSPVHRSPETIAVEIALTLGQALLAGLCAWLAIADRQTGSVVAVLGLLSVGIVVGYAIWLIGGPGTVMTLVNVPLLPLAIYALLVSLGVANVDPGLTSFTGAGPASVAIEIAAIASSVLGIACGVLVPGPRRHRIPHRHRGMDTGDRAHAVFGANLLRLQGAMAAQGRRRERARLASQRAGQAGAQGNGGAVDADQPYPDDDRELGDGEAGAVGPSWSERTIEPADVPGQLPPAPQQAPRLGVTYGYERFDRGPRSAGGGAFPEAGAGTPTGGAYPGPGVARPYDPYEPHVPAAPDGDFDTDDRLADAGPGAPPYGGSRPSDRYPAPQPYPRPEPYQRPDPGQPPEPYQRVDRYQRPVPYQPSEPGRAPESLWPDPPPPARSPSVEPPPSAQQPRQPDLYRRHEPYRPSENGDGNGRPDPDLPIGRDGAEPP